MKISFDSEWRESLREYPAEVRVEVYEAVIDYIVSGTTSVLKPMANLAFTFIKKDIEKSRDISAKRSEAGKKGAILLWQSHGNAMAMPDKAMAEKKEEGKEKATQKENQESKRGKEKSIDKSIPKKKDDRVVFVESLPEDWQNVVMSWLRYKIDRNENYKSLSSLKIFYRNLQEYSGNNVSVAQKVVDQSIGNNWQGIFPLKNQSHTGTTKSPFVDLPTDYSKPQPGFHI